VTSRRGGGGGTGVQARGRGEKLLGLGDLASQGVGRVALAFPDEGGRAHTGLALRGGGPGSDKSRGKSEVRSSQAERETPRRAGLKAGGGSSSQETLVQRLERLDWPKEGLWLGDVGLRLLEMGLRLLEMGLDAISGLEVGLDATIGLETTIGGPRVLNSRRSEDLGRGGCSSGASRKRKRLEMWLAQLWLGKSCGRERGRAAGVGSSHLQARAREGPGGGQRNRARMCARGGQRKHGRGSRGRSAGQDLGPGG
jgi:hypothetical protein